MTIPKLVEQGVQFIVLNAYIRRKAMLKMNDLNS